MCLVIVNVDGRTIPREYVRTAHSRNDDSFGIMFSMENKLTIHKGLMKIEEIEACFDWVEKTSTPYIAHFRMSTHGATDFNNAHPFIIDSNNRGGIGMVHNGVISEFSGGYGWGGFGGGTGKSDTANFVDQVIKDIAAGVYSFDDLFEPEAEKMVKIHREAINSYNKLAFMDGDGNMSIVNEHQGTWIGGAWYSNKYGVGRILPEHACKENAEMLHNLDELMEYLEEADELLAYARGERIDDDLEFDIEIDESAIDAAFDSLDKDEVDDEIVTHPFARSNGYDDDEFDVEEAKRLFSGGDLEGEDTIPFGQSIRDEIKEEINNANLVAALKRVEDEDNFTWQDWVRAYNNCSEATTTTKSESATPLMKPVTTPIKPTSTSPGYYGSFGGTNYKGSSYTGTSAYSYTPTRTWEDEIVDAFLKA